MTGTRILLQRRTDSGNWALPGGAMDIGETLAESAIREMKEETGLDVRIERIVGIYSDPGHVFAYDDGEVWHAPTPGVQDACFKGRHSAASRSRSRPMARSRIRGDG